MSKKDEALKLALRSLRELVPDDSDHAPALQGQRMRQKKAIDVAREALAEQPTQQEICGGCKGSGWVTRDPDIGTDQECFVCEGKGTVEPEQPAQQEPVAWGIVASNTGRICQVELDADEVEGHNPKHIVPLYTSPPAQRTWVNATTWRGLTDEEVQAAVYDENGCVVDYENYAEAIEAKLKERNT